MYISRIVILLLKFLGEVYTSVKNFSDFRKAITVHSIYFVTFSQESDYNIMQSNTLILLQGK